jgi:hypothetical protein
LATRRVSSRKGRLPSGPSQHYTIRGRPHPTAARLRPPGRRADTNEAPAIPISTADCNDDARLADDAVHKLLLDRDRLTCPALASQATVSRFEKAVGPLALTQLGHTLADLVIEQHRMRRQSRARRLTIDLARSAVSIASRVACLRTWSSKRSQMDCSISSVSNSTNVPLRWNPPIAERLLLRRASGGRRHAS